MGRGRLLFPVLLFVGIGYWCNWWELDTGAFGAIFKHPVLR